MTTVSEISLTNARLREVVSYDPMTGEFIWMETDRRKKKGERAGHYNKWQRNRYVNIGIDGKIYQAHRVAWFYMTGEWPKDQIDHIDGDGWNNRWSNLREATDSENRCNTGLQSNNKSGVKGIYFRPPRPEIQKRCASYEVKLNSKYICTCSTLAEAKATREQAAKLAHGEFYRAQ